VSSYAGVLASSLTITHDFFSSVRPDPDDVDPENPYFRFGKQVHRKYLGFGTMGSAFFTRNLINDTLVQDANDDRSETSLLRLKEAVAKHT
jgi:hypothetical protein